jgi:DNA-binding beta-propeller fold protein YncE
MDSIRSRLTVILLASFLLLVGGVTASRATNASNRGGSGKAWIERYGHRPGGDYATDLVVSPDGSTVFVTGDAAQSCCSEPEFATVAYDATTGAPRWLATYHGPGRSDTPRAVAVSPDGSAVYVAGQSGSGNLTSGFATLRYDAVTGSRQWLAREDNPNPTSPAGAFSIAVGPDGATVYATGDLTDQAGHLIWVTVAYDAVDGSQRWRTDRQVVSGTAQKVIPSPDGTRVYVAGTNDNDIMIDAYDATTGELIDSALYQGPNDAQDLAYDAVLSPDGSRIFVTGESLAKYITLAFDAADLSTVWKAWYRVDDTTDAAYAIAVSPDGSHVSVTGYSDDGDGSDLTIVTYEAAKGHLLWAARANPGEGWDLAYSADGSKVAAVGEVVDSTVDYRTVVYDVTTGTLVDSFTQDGFLDEIDSARAVVASPLGGRFFVTGWIDEDNSRFPKTDWATIAYDVP